MDGYDIIIIGGGPAGFFAALAAAEAHSGQKILILEKNRKPLGKVRISGGGRCNLTHACFDPAKLAAYYPRGAKELRGPFTRFQPRDTVSWFEDRGVELKTEPDGRIFPVTDRSETIVDCILGEADKRGVELATSSNVEAITRTDKGFSLQATQLGTLTASKVLLATGGGSQNHYDLASNLGHTIIPPVPSLFTFNIRDPRLEGLAGISLPEVEISLLPPKPGKHKPTKSKGPLLITHWGLSGPAVLRLSAWEARLLAESNYRIKTQMNWLPQYTQENILEILQIEKKDSSRRTAFKNVPNGLLPNRLWQKLVAAAGIEIDKPWGEISNKALRSLADQILLGEFLIQGKGVFKEEFVTCGGISLKEVNFKTLESRICPGLFFAGEILDIDGLTGGFNFQAAWTTGWLAGKAMAEGFKSTP